jgi:tetratricopeptide (TPR) repeat protein
MRTLILSASILALAACGAPHKGADNVAHKAVPPPPPLTKTNDVAEPGKPATPKREISSDARADYKAALENFKNNDKGAWNDGACKGAADKFASVVREHPELVEAQFMVGLSYHKCNMLDDAEKAYQAASHMKGDATKIAMALSNLGEIYYKAGKIDGAKQYWDSAIKANGKLIAARINVASMELEQMRKINNPKDANWKKLEEDARFNLSNALGVDTDSVAAYTQFGLIYMEGWQQNKNRLDLAKTLLDEGKKRNEKYPPLQNAYGLYYMHKVQLNQALQSFQAAVEADPKFVEARVNAGLLTLGFRKYDLAKDLFAKALDVAPKNYNAMIGLGVAQRGLGDLDGAEATYKKAKDIDPRKGDAYFNLGVLYKDFRANKQNNPNPIEALKASSNMYKQAREWFTQFLDKDGDASDKTEAKNNIADCDKVMKQLENAVTSLQNQPPMPAAPPAPAATPAPAAGGAAPPAAGAPAKK